MSHETIESHLVENRVFNPPEAFARGARVTSLEDYQTRYEASIKDPAAFWANEAAELDWQTPWSETLRWEAPFAQWFVGGKMNLSENCVDRHANNPNRKYKVAILFEGEPGDTRSITYGELQQEVARTANMFLAQGIKTGDRVIVYMPMIPEAAITMLACARIGAVHSVIFGGFSATAIYDRVLDSGATHIITADGGWRRGKTVPLKDNVDAALQMGTTPIQKVVVFQRTKQAVAMEAGRDVWWHEAIATASADCPPVGFDSEHPLFILYTSGSTGKPKGILHTTGGYAVGTYATTKYIFDLQEKDVYWCTADVGWITGHSYIVYGPLANGATVLMYEGAPDTPHFGRFWEIVEKYKVSILYTAPTAIRAFIKWGDEHITKYDLSSLRLLGSVGEPINPEAWMWYHKVIGGGRCPIVDTWWQTETGAILISPLPGATPTKPGTATLPFFGIDAAIVDETGQECAPNEGGRLVVRHPWPSMLRTLWGDAERYAATYWAEYPGWYLTGDGARRDEDGYFWIVGRLDDVLNVSGHRLGTAELESALASHPAVAEAAVVGRPDEIKGQAPVAFVTLKTGFEASHDLAKALKAHVAKEIGAIARPDDIRFTASLPKTRSGKIMRRLLKEICSGGQIKGDTTTLDDLSVLASLSAAAKADDE
jgi:acetyl-CoA synthetase